MIDLTEAVEAAAKAAHESGAAYQLDRPTWEELDPISRHALREAVLPVVQAVAPAIAAQALRVAADELYGDDGPRGIDGGFNLRSTATWLRERADRQ